MSTQGSRPHDSVRGAILRIERWFTRHAPSAGDNKSGGSIFHAPAAPARVIALEQQLGIAPTPPLRQLLDACDGSHPGAYPVPMRRTRPTNWRLLSVAEIGVEWERLNEVSKREGRGVEARAVGPVQPKWWSLRWVPIAECGTGDFVCIDLEPGSGGTLGQLVLYAHDFAERTMLYSSITDWLEESAADLDRGVYLYVPGVGLAPKS